MVRIGLLGCGNVGRLLVMKGIGIEIEGLFDVVRERAELLSSICHARVYPDFDSFIRGDFDLVVEAASVEAVFTYGERILTEGKDLLVLSAGALSFSEFRERLVDLARKQKKKIYVPSGAVLGLDNLKVGQITGFDRLLLRTTKNPSSLRMETDRRVLLFSGKAQDCIRQFPKNINVAVALSLAAGQDADVEIWADPGVDRNIHEIFAEGEFGRMEIRVENVPSPENPATSYLAALSILTLLKNLENPLVVGT
ncbi:MAG: aspartate dehydrogenase [Methanomicrobiales archaeon]|nr:aspartate dehydrogenase [Methanomicrobiales archaeon]